MFDDRKDAGRQLAHALERYRSERALVLAIPRGGAEVGYEVAKHLNAEFSLLIARKLPYPHNPESGFGAIAEDGSMFVIPGAEREMTAEASKKIVAQQQTEIENRIRILRGGRPLPDIQGRTLILTDDGMAMGSTMRAAIELCRNRQAGKIVVGVPVAGPRTVAEISRLVDDVVVVETPPHFRAVAQVYRNWYDVSDGEVLEIIQRWQRENPQQ